MGPETETDANSEGRKSPVNDDRAADSTFLLYQENEKNRADGAIHANGDVKKVGDIKGLARRSLKEYSNGFNL